MNDGKALPSRRRPLEQIQLLLGHSSVQTTERYLGTKQDLVHAPNDGIKPQSLACEALSQSERVRSQ